MLESQTYMTETDAFLLLLLVLSEKNLVPEQRRAKFEISTPIHSELMLVIDELRWYYRKKEHGVKPHL